MIRWKHALPLLAVLVPATVVAKESWDKKPSEWTREEAQQILVKSPWVQTVNVFPATLRAENDKPTQTQERVGVFVRWQSAGVVREAVARLMELAGGLTEAQKTQLTRPEDRFYMITVSAPETLAAIEAVPFETLAANTTLEADGTKYPLVNVVKPSQNNNQPEAVFLFEKGKGIPATAKTANFSTKFGTAEIEAKFKLDKMTWNGKRDLDGDFGNVSEAEKRRREIQAAVLGAGDEAFGRAITDVRVEKRGNAKRPWAVYVFYDPTRELSNPAEAKMVDTEGRKRAVSSAVGKWSTANKSSLEAIIFVDPAAGKAVDYIVGADAEKLSKMEGDAAAKFFKEKLQSADQKAGKTGKSSEAPKDEGKKVATKTDQDGDGVPNEKDKCQSSADPAKVDATGCP